MYLKSVEVWNFGAIAHEKQQYVNGMIVVRGRNGGGKTTMTIQAPMYAFFGASTLEATLEETVRRGEKPTSMKVVVEYGPYTVSRTKSSASVVGNGIQISGQAEVSDFFYNLFGIQKGAEEAVLVSYQGETAGIIRKKPAEVTATIESLAGFYQIDELMERVKAKYPSGNKAILEDQLVTCEADLQKLKEAELPDIGPLQKIVASTAMKLAETEEIVAERVVKKERAEANLRGAEDHNWKVLQAAKDHAQAVKAVNETKDVIAELRQKTYKKFSIEEITAAEAILATVDARRRAWDAYVWWKTLTPQEDVWQGDFMSFEQELISTAKDVKDRGMEIVTLETEIRLKKDSVITDKVCKTCGQDVTHLHEDLNKKLADEIKIYEMTLEVARNGLTESKNTLSILNKINNEQLRRVRKADLEFVKANTEVVPHTYEWIGSEPVQPEEGEIGKASELLAEFKSTAASKKRDAEEIVKLMTKLEKQKLAAADAYESKATVGEKLPVEPLVELVALAKEDLKAWEQKRSAEQAALSQAEKDLLQAELITKHRAENIATAEQLRSSIKQRLKQDDRNTKMLKSVREAKVLVLNQIWDRILTSVSQVYSDMMGREMVVEKAVKGFQVNGGPATRLSGAERSTLGIAMRDAMRNVFSPGCSFIFLDEPWSDMDVDVRANAVAALYNIRGQRFVITHEEDSSLGADQIIEYER